ncbi:hypothetical protein ID866_2490, partial [Astraeus odoratus]
LRYGTLKFSILVSIKWIHKIQRPIEPIRVPDATVGTHFIQDMKHSASSSDSTTAPVPPATRRWVPTHRAGSSVDVVRGKWEERARAEAALEGRRPVSPSKELSRSSSISSASRVSTPPALLESLPSSRDASIRTDESSPQRTPLYLKRQTLPAHITAVPLSPNTTDVSGVKLHTITTFYHHFLFRFKREHPFAVASLQYPRQLSVHSFCGAAGLDKVIPTVFIVIVSAIEYVLETTCPTGCTNNISSPETHFIACLDLAEIPSQSSEQLLYGVSSSPSTSLQSSVMSPTPYRSSYMLNKKTSMYGQLGGRRLGRHLPRIASGDGDENWEDENVNVESSKVKPSNSLDEMYSRHHGVPLSPVALEGVVHSVNSADDVAGIPGRLRLSRDKLSAPTSPMSTSRWTRGLWADTQRHLLQAYEYLCHVGEAQQWIEGCLGEELGFGVVEMEDRLRNGVALARLARAFQGERVVRRIYEAPKLDFRHSDNINYFFAFVREVGLPECFIFELTDLYEKKNLPKVIYCIHALSHLLARRGLAQRIGNLLGQLQFSDDQLQKTQKGLNDAGVTMPNFGDVGRELAKEINEDPDVEPETEDERCERVLMENEESIRGLQCKARGFLARRAYSMQHARIQLAARYIVKVQALCRGVLVHRQVLEARRVAAGLLPWIIRLQAIARGSMERIKWHAHLVQIRAAASYAVAVQAQGRGVLKRKQFAALKAALHSKKSIIIQLQSLARAKVTRQGVKALSKTLATIEISSAVAKLQAAARGFLKRTAISKQLRQLDLAEDGILGLQAQCRGVLVRRQIRTQLSQLDDISSTIVRIQTATRTYLARKRLLALIRGLRRATPMIVGLQARARASLACQHRRDVNKALSEIRLVASVGGFQARARAALARNRHREQHKRLEFVVPDVTGMQAAARTYLVRREYIAWRTHLWKSQAAATMLQALLRGALQRMKFRIKMEYYHSNLDKVVKIQSLFRAKETREQYRQLTLGKNVTVGTIKNFVNLLDDSEADFQDEIKVERLRKKVVESIRENQALENDVSDLDVKIALVVQNVKSFEELIKARRRYGADNVAVHASRASILAAHGDPFAGPTTLDHAAKRKLELYQQLFYLLQTQGEYLSKLFLELTDDESAEKHRPLAERVVLTLFGYGQDRREDYLLLKLFQLSIRQEVASASRVEDVIHGHPMYMSIAVQYLRPKQVPYVRETLQATIHELTEAIDLDLESDPSIIHRSRIDIEEMRSGIASNKPRDVPFYEALKDPDTRAEYIRHLQKLQWWSEAFMSAILQSAKRVPYGMRFIAREMLASLRVGTSYSR